jgi:hypothetical protein
MIIWIYYCNAKILRLHVYRQLQYKILINNNKNKIFDEMLIVMNFWFINCLIN